MLFGVDLRRSSVLAIAAWLIGSVMGSPQALDAAPKKVASVEGITEYSLDNGLRVLLFPDASRPTVTVNLTIFVGSRHEGYGETGMAHLLEHMVFKGTPTHPNIPKVLSERGAQFNGTTSDDRTNYFETLPASVENLEFALRLESDRMINSFIKREDLLSEMTVVRNEFERGENSPSRILFQRMSAAAYDWHNYGKSTIGNRSDIERVPIENLQAFYRKHYQPDNAMVVVAGKFEEAKALELIEATFGAIPRPARELPKTYTEEPAQDGERSVMLRRVGDVAMVGAAYHVPAASHPEFASVSVLSRILATQPSGRLYQGLVQTQKASSVFGFAFGRHDPTLVIVGAEVPKEQSAEETLAALIEATEATGRDGVTAEEVKRAQQELLKEWELSAANTTGIAVSLSTWASQGDWRLYFLYRDRIEQVTVDSVKEVAGKYLRRNNRTTGLFLPTSQSDRVAVPETPDIAAMVKDYKGRASLAAGEVFDVAPDKIEARTTRSELPEGLRVALLPKQTRGETVVLSLRLRYGDAKSLAGRSTAANFLPELMTRGVKSLNFQQLRDALDREKVQLSASGDPGVATFTLQTKRANMPAALDLLRQILREPTLPSEELDVLKREALAEMEQSLSDPQALAVNMVRREFTPYASTDPRYTPTIAESVERIKALTLADVRSLYEQMLGIQAGELVVVGDFDRAAVEGFTKSLSGWKSATPYARLERDVPAERTVGTRTIDTPDKENAMYLAAMLLPLRNDDPDYAAIVVGNYVLGGGSLSSRLGDRVRQKEGLSYGVGSAFAAGALDRRATFQMYAICNPINMAKLELVMAEEVGKWAQEGVTAEEVARAQNGLIQQAQVARSSDGRLADLLGDSLFEERTMAFQADLERQIKAVTPETVSAAMRKHIDPKKLLIIKAGDFSKVDKATTPATPPTKK